MANISVCLSGPREHLAGQWHHPNHVQHPVRCSCARPPGGGGSACCWAGIATEAAARCQAGAWLRIPARAGLLSAWW